MSVKATRKTLVKMISVLKCYVAALLKLSYISFFKEPFDVDVLRKKKYAKKWFKQRIIKICSVFKVRLHIRFPHAFSALHCDFLLLTLIEQNQGKL